MSGVPPFEIRAGEVQAQDADIAIVYRLRGDAGIVGPVSAGLAERLMEVAREDRFHGRAGRRLLWHAPPDAGSRARRILLLGLGGREDLTVDRYRRALGEALVEADRLGATTVALPLPTGDGLPFDARAAGRAVAEGFWLGTYRFDRYRSDPRPGRRHLKQIVVACGGAPIKDVQKGVERGETLANATNFARDLVNEPAGVLTPARMAEIATDAAKRSGLEIKVFGPDEMRAQGMGGILGVGQGSTQTPRLIHLIYRPHGKPTRRIAFVGKGLTFDSGGLSLKTAEGMETMKCDMAGSAAVLATLCALRELGVTAEVHGVMGMAENMPGGGAIRPGDVVRIMNGKTIEVRNTDAEGRVVLADCLAYVSRLEGVDTAIDLATLTGACVVALGPMACGVMGNDRGLIDEILAASEAAGEPMWPLPLYPEYREHIKSDIADVKNTGIRWGGAITAALLLQEFVRDGMRWAHLDIAGPAFGEKEYSYLGKGGSGVGVRTLLRLLTGPA
ncbi:MAG TPA: leucyl aminopeptidase [Dongiaceae bacterium]|nr:leucyl aminopeptidase [Dongiaceae bacterium]